MDPRTEKKIYSLAAGCVVLTALAFVIPRLGGPGGEGGLAAAATAVLVFLASLAVAAVLSLYLLVTTLQARSQIGFGARVAGITPGVILVLGLVWLVFFLRF